MMHDSLHKRLYRTVDACNIPNCFLIRPSNGEHEALTSNDLSGKRVDSSSEHLSTSQSSQPYKHVTPQPKAQPRCTAKFHTYTLSSITTAQIAVAALREVYGDDIEACDLLVGNLAEKKIPGFAISETAFHIFILMASRRLEADRFLTEHYNADVYTQEGLAWVSKTRGLRDVIARHYPALAQEMPPTASAFNAYTAMPAFDPKTAL